jgi:DNA-binding response OmpR family regulator
VPVPPKALAVLGLLASQAGHRVSKATLLDTVWAGTTVSEARLTSCLRTLRRSHSHGADCYYLPENNTKGYFSPFAPSISHFLNFKLPVERST